MQMINNKHFHCQPLRPGQAGHGGRRHRQETGELLQETDVGARQLVAPQEVPHQEGEGSVRSSTGLSV